MKRLAYLAALSLVVIGFAGTTTAAAPASRWKDLNAALTPVNLALNDDVIGFNGAIADANTAQASVAYSSVLNNDTLQAAIGKLASAESRMNTLAKAMKADSAKGMKVLDGFTWESCYRHFAAVEYTMFSAWNDTAVELLANEPPVSSGAAFYLSGYGVSEPHGPVDDQWDHVTCAGASPSPPPPAAPSPSA